jgi:hypothetical protein
MDVLGKKMMYHARIFANGLYVMTVKTPERGQRFIRATLHAPNFGLFGEKTQVSLMINRKIKPHIFDGHIMEIDFDIVDAVQLGDLLDICPELVLDLNPNYKKYLEVKKASESIDAQFTVKPEEGKNKVIDSLFEELDKEIGKEKPENQEENQEEERRIDAVIRNGKTAFEIAATAFPFLPGIRNLKKADDDTDEKIRKVIDLCNKSPAHKKCLYWVAEYLGVDKEIHWIVSQSRPIRTGIDPNYYKAQTGAAIAEKVLSRPKEPEGWQTVVLILGIVGFIVVAIALILHGGF